MTGTTVVATFYRFTPLPDYRERRGPLLAFCRARGLLGTILLAEEGINAIVAGPRRAVDALLARLRSEPAFAGLDPRESLHAEPPFLRMKVKLKREIVTMGSPRVEPQRTVGTYVEPRDWNALVDDPRVLLVDTRNAYEVGIGTFRGAVDPDTRSFREFPVWARAHLDPRRQRKVALFCTGGIRCEKAAGYLLQQGFETVYQLRGGILRYLEEVPVARSSWQGECFVFDDRVAVNHALERGSYEQCFACRHPLSVADRRSPHYESAVSCPHCHGALDPGRRARFAERRRQTALARSRGERHIGARLPRAASVEQ